MGNTKTKTLFARKHWSKMSQRSRKLKYKVHVTTGDRRGAGTDSNVYLSLHDNNGKKTEEVLLDCWWRNDLERASTNTFTITLDTEFGNINYVEIHRDQTGVGDAWYLDRIVVEDNTGQVKKHFPVHRWIAPYVCYRLKEYDCILPQNDPHKDQRAKELKQKKETYEYVMNIEDGPVQCKSLPEDEQFSGEYLWDIVSNKLKLRFGSSLVNLMTGLWKSLVDLKNIYKFSLDEPQCLPHWTEDYWFGLQRVQGTNPVLLRLCQDIPSNFGVEASMVEPFLEGHTLKHALKEKRIFIIDLQILENLYTTENTTLCAPLALFYLNDSHELLPIAIQLFQKKGPNNPVFLPTDPQYTWLLAKMYYNNSDAMYHQSCTHLGLTHLLMEGVVVCTHRNLSPSHPLFRLMAPHFLFLLAINSRGLDKLISPGGWVDKTMTIGRTGMFQLITRSLNKWKLDKNGIFLNDFKCRGVDDPKVLPHYPYREDSLALYNAIRRYVSTVVKHYYDTPESIAEDWELQQWRQELVKDKKSGGIGLQGVSGNEEGLFTEVNEIIDLVTVIISICSINHSAANFYQYNEYAFPPNYPGILYGEPPRDKSPVTEDDIIKHLPDKSITLDIITITSLLSSKGTKSLGDFEVQYLYDPVSVEAAAQFREELKEISRNIQRRNCGIMHPYPWLDPVNVPNSISI